MGSMIHLAVGDLEIDWGKNDFFIMHSSLFQREDLTQIVREYVDDNNEPIMEEVAVRPLSKMVGRLELMGYTFRTAKKLFASIANKENIASFISFEMVAKALRRVDIDYATTILQNYTHRLFFAKNADHLQISPPSSEDILQNGFDNYNEKLFSTLSQAEADVFILKEFMESLSSYSPYTVLRLLAENPKTATREVSWTFADVVENGWVHRDRIVSDLGQVSSFLVVTEGSSDSKVLKHALNILRPEVADFFYFVDMGEGYPFTGEGNLYRFCQGLVSIGIENNVVVVYDNDAVGLAGYEKTSKLRLPKNMRVIRLPDCESLRQFDTIGPNGGAKADINGRAAAIECYLDLQWKQRRHPIVHWTGDEKQGKLQNKEYYTRQFLRLNRRDPEYDYSKIEAVLKSLVSVSIEIAEERFSGQEPYYMP